VKPNYNGHDSFSSFLALPPKISVRSWSFTGAASIHLRPARLDMNGQSIENRILPTPISAIEQVSAELENAPLVVSQKCSR